MHAVIIGNGAKRCMYIYYIIIVYSAGMYINGAWPVLYKTNIISTIKPCMYTHSQGASRGTCMCMCMCMHVITCHFEVLRPCSTCICMT